MNLKIDFTFINPDTKAQTPQKTTIIAKLTSHMGVKDFDKMLNITMPTINTRRAMIKRTLTLNLNILYTKYI